MGDIYSGHDWKYGIAEGATFKTAIADASAFNQLSCENFVINPDNKLRTPERASAQRFRDLADIAMDQKGSTPMCVIPTEVLKTEIDFWLYLICQYVVESATTPYAKTFTLPTIANTPDFSANEGEFISLVKYSPIASTSEKISSMVAQGLDLSFKDGFLFANIDLIGLGYSRTSDPSGTWTKAGQSRFHINDISLCQIGGADVILKDWSLSIKSKVIPAAPGSGSWGNFALAGWEVKSMISVINDANARTARANMDSGTETTIQIKWGTTGVDGNLDFTIRGIMETAPDQHGDTADITFNLTGVSDIAGTQEIFTAVVANAVDRSW
jgi:hypothetical protein